MSERKAGLRSTPQGQVRCESCGCMRVCHYSTNTGAPDGNCHAIVYTPGPGGNGMTARQCQCKRFVAPEKKP